MEPTNDQMERIRLAMAELETQRNAMAAAFKRATELYLEAYTGTAQEESVIATMMRTICESIGVRMSD